MTIRYRMKLWKDPIQGWIPIMYSPKSNNSKQTHEIVYYLPSELTYAPVGTNKAEDGMRSFQIEPWESGKAGIKAQLLDAWRYGGNWKTLWNSIQPHTGTGGNPTFTVSISTSGTTLTISDKRNRGPLKFKNPIYTFLLHFIDTSNNDSDVLVDPPIRNEFN